MDIKSVRKDVKTISEGTWVSDIPNCGDLRLKVRGMTAPAVREFRAKAERAVSFEDRDRDGSIKPETSLKILGDTLLEVVLLDWEGLTDEGNPVKYNKALAKEWLTNPEYEQFGDAVVWAAHYVDRSKISNKEKVEGNSSKS